jgi:hypothetical protein
MLSKINDGNTIRAKGRIFLIRLCFGELLMLRWLMFLLLLFSCSFGAIKSGGDRTYIYDVYHDYPSEELKSLAPQVVTTLSRDPQLGTLSDLFSKKQKPIKRFGIIVFESMIQETRSGLSGDDKVYLSEQGKQLLTERLLSIWEQSLPILGSDFVYIPMSKIKKSPNLKKYGFEVPDYIKSKRHSLAPDDIFFLPPGKITTTSTVLNPRGMRDLSLALVPATDLMHGPKFSEHMKHAVNDVAKELNLDALLVVMSEIFWTASHVDKKTGLIIPEQVKTFVKLSTLIPLSQYHERLNKLGYSRDLPKTTLAYRSYESELRVPVLLSVSAPDQTFNHIEKKLLDPMIKTYNDQSQMVMLRMIEDLKATH